MTLDATPEATRGSAGGTAGQARPWRAAGDLLVLLGPATAAGALLTYFGYVSERTFYGYFGISLTVLEQSSTTYVIRSADALFRPVVTALLLLGVLVAVHALAGRWLERATRTRARGATLIVLAVAAVLAGAGLLGLYRPPQGTWAPFALGGAVLLLEYAAWTATVGGLLAPATVARLRVGAPLRRGVVVALVLVTAFWGVTDLAQTRGRSTARVVERTLPILPQAVVYSSQDLHLPGPGVGVARLDADHSAYRFRYNGLRPLVHAGGRWFLLPVGWTRAGLATVVVLDDQPGRVRVDLAPGLGP